MDLLICEYELPLPEEASSLVDVPDWQELEFHTFSLKSIMDDPFILDKYTISEDGQIYKDAVEREIVRNEDGSVELEEKDAGIEKQEYTGELVFSGVHMEEEYDYFMEFSALFWKGDLKEIVLEKWERDEARKRILAQEAISGKAEELFKERNDNVFLKACKSFVFFFFWLIRWSVGLVIKLTWKLERWLT